MKFLLSEKLRHQVAYRDQEAVLSVVITGNDGPVLMGRDWSVLKLDWGQIKRISLEPVNRLDLLQTKYSSLFDGNLWTIKGVSAHLKLKKTQCRSFLNPGQYRSRKKKILQTSFKDWKRSVYW